MENNNSRYSRQHLFPYIGKAGQEKLNNSRVAIVGVGALGSAIANHMVRSGVGYVRIIDRDYVEYSNLQRQLLYDESDVEENLPKAIAAMLKLRAINSSVIIDAKIADLNWKNAEDLLADVDLIIDGSDNFDVRYLINDVSIKHKIPWIYGGAVSSRGMTFTIIPDETPCFRCVFPEQPAHGTTDTCDTAGVIGPIIHVIAAYQSTEALKILLADFEHLSNSLRNFELWHNDYSEIKLKNARNEDCPTCVHHEYNYLDPTDKKDRFAALCGRDTVQISPMKTSKFDLKQLAEKLRPHGELKETPYLLKFQIDNLDLTIFPDGRIMVHGTNDVVVAKNIYAKYIGS